MVKDDRRRAADHGAHSFAQEVADAFRAKRIVDLHMAAPYGCHLETGAGELDQRPAPGSEWRREPCHRVILAGSSPLLKEALASSGADLILMPDVSFATLGKVLYFLYLGSVEVNGRQDCEGICSALDNLGVSGYSVEAKTDHEDRKETSNDIRKDKKMGNFTASATPCELCAKLIKVKRMAQHLKDVHLKHRPHICPVCQRGCTKKTELKNHMRTHTKERPFTCEFCGKSFTLVQVLNRHLRKVHWKVGLCFGCSLCGKTFGQKSDLEKHAKLHRGEKPFVCDVCGQTFARADYLRRHVASLHLRTRSGDPVGIKMSSAQDSLVMAFPEGSGSSSSSWALTGASIAMNDFRTEDVMNNVDPNFSTEASNVKCLDITATICGPSEDDNDLARIGMNSSPLDRHLVDSTSLDNNEIKEGSVVVEVIASQFTESDVELAIDDQIVEVIDLEDDIKTMDEVELVVEEEVVIIEDMLPG